jgi:predicted restriction endonuclease
MNRAQLLECFSNLVVWGSGEKRAPHKPLLILYALACFARGQFEVPFSEVEPVIIQLLREFGPARKVHHPEYPFGACKMTKFGRCSLLRRQHSGQMALRVRENWLE